MAEPLPSAAEIELTSVIAEAWEIFGSRYRFGRPLELCRCNVCVQPETEALLLKTPVREMPAKLLQAYTESAHASSTYADDQFRALLPRYFQLMAVGDWPAHSVEIGLRRLVDAGWRERWPREEVALIDCFLRALFSYWLTTREGRLGRTEAQSILAMVAIAGGNVEPLLALWDRDRSLTASIKLCRFHIRHFLGQTSAAARSVLGGHAGARTTSHRLAAPAAEQDPADGGFLSSDRPQTAGSAVLR